MKSKLTNHNEVLEALAETIDISEHMDQLARDRYKSIGEWLNRENSSIREHEPEIYAQGSFLLGTVISPITENDAYDVDVVCTLQISRDSISMLDLKDAIGKEIKGYTTAQNMKNSPEDGQRCWTIEYADQAQFHMDILPSIPDETRYKTLLQELQREDLLGNKNIVSSAIAITDNTLPQYSYVSDDWPISNPKGYAVWFDSRQEATLDDKRTDFVEKKVYLSVDDVPRHKIKTPLQQAIQLLKRHRDVMFDGRENKPISIIITTLAAHAYYGEKSITETLRALLRSMESFIEDRNGEAWVQNPVNPKENFADKWSKVPEKEQNFYEWAVKAQTDFGEYFTYPFNNIPSGMREKMTSSTMDKVIPFIALVAMDTASANIDDEVEVVKEAGSSTRPWQK